MTYLGQGKFGHFGFFMTKSEQYGFLVHLSKVFLKLAQNVCFDIISVKFSHGWDGVKK